MTIRLRGICQNNLANIDLDLPLGQLIVVTGVSGSGKSSLAFDTVYAEGQRRYVETFSPYARQFLDRMDRPHAERIDGIPPAIAIDQVNPVRTSRSTVGTMTELDDHLKLLYARAARPFCRGCGREVVRDTAETIWEQVVAFHPKGARIVIAFAVPIPEGQRREDILDLLSLQGYVRTLEHTAEAIEVVQDRLRVSEDKRGRAIEGLQSALERGHGAVRIYTLGEDGTPGNPMRFSSGLHCPDCDIQYADLLPNHFSFNSPLGACETCRGFGRVIGVDWGLVVPDPGKSLLDGAIKPFQSDRFGEHQEDLIGYARRRGVPTDVPWNRLDEADRAWVIEGEGDWDEGVWYGVRRFFDWLERRAYKMHVRVLLSRYRAYDPCPQCQGARLRDEALDWRLGSTDEAARVLAPERRFFHARATIDPARRRALPGLCIHDVMCLSIGLSRRFFAELAVPDGLAEALDNIRSRLGYLCEVGLGYLTLERQSRTLSGGEVQRISLTTALGTGLVETLFVLDEPSIGLHPRDMDRIVGILERLRDQGNTLLVVEHDPAVMLAADRIIELGPGPGNAGGRIVFDGSPAELVARGQCLTADYLTGRRRVAPAAPRVPGKDDPGRLCVFGAAANNLAEIDVELPLNRLVVITGVSGSGKSTLVQDVLYNALAKHFGQTAETPGAHRAITGVESIGAVELLDQAPLGRTTRSNPASVVGAFDPIRKLFAATALARERGYTASTFSFNAGTGRCPTCNGAGFEQIEMQFLSDVYLRCPDCNGRRYRAPVLDVTIDPDGGPGRSIVDVLEMTTNEALAFFASQRPIARALEPLEAVGLGYLRLGQPVPTLSGGEAQRLKLAAQLAKARQGRAKRRLFMLDEPTTGLHFHDIANLLTAFRRLLVAGHSLVVIEHNLDVIRAADWIVDLGPEGGEDGGRVVCTGTPDTVAAHPTSHTARALRSQADAIAEAPGPRYAGKVARPASHSIEVVRAREHNLRIDRLEIPRERLTVITGVSGSGKSTLAFDILFAEGQRRYLESLNAYARQFVQPPPRAEVDAVLGLPPTVAIEQRTSRGGHKSTVGTLTEIHHFMRLLFVKLGVQHCPDCNEPIRPSSREAIRERVARDYAGRRIAVLAPLVLARKGYYNELAQWAQRQGYFLLRVDGEPVSTTDWPRLDRYREHNIDLPVGEVDVGREPDPGFDALLADALEIGKGMIRVAAVEHGRWSEPERSFSTRRSCPGCGRAFDEPDPRLFSYNSRHGWCPSCYGTGLELPGFDAEQTGEERQWADGRVESTGTCHTCGGRRLNPEALAVRIADGSIADYAGEPVRSLMGRLEAIVLDERELEIAREPLAEIRHRLAFLDRVGLGYLRLDRAAPTLSGGEAQRIRLAAQLGSNLRGVCYVLDEPTIGLHPRDNRLLLDTLADLQAKGNTVLVVEHDEETIRVAHHVIDLGPGAGEHGGRLVAAGDVDAIIANPDSITGRYLGRPIGVHEPRGTDGCTWLRIQGAHRHNLADLNLGLPLGRFVCVTGVSGSGKSTLVRDVLGVGLAALLGAERSGNGRKRALLNGCKDLVGGTGLSRVLEVDQSPIGKTPRSCVATYVGIWDAIRRLYAATPEARMLGLSAGHFSFNTRGGRCSACEGQGTRKLEMSFLPDVEVPCEVCGGSRFDRETREIRYKGLDIGGVLGLSVEQAAERFSAHPGIRHPLELLEAVGLGYIRLGQASPTLSGGEAQRIKLVTELAKARPSADGITQRPTLYLLDEPTVGLHMADVERLLGLLQRLVDAGHSLVVIEHNLELIAAADWVVDLGPEGGDGGGRVVAEGPPDAIARVVESHTGLALRRVLGIIK